MQATLNSNSGEAAVSIAFDAPAEYAHDVGFECSVAVRGEHWDGDHTFPIHASVEGLWLRVADVAELHHSIASWLSRPLEELRPADLDGEFELARLPHQSVAVRFGARPDTLASFNPVVSWKVAAGAVAIDFHFVTDQSCLTIFSHDLASALSNPRATQTA